MSRVVIAVICTGAVLLSASAAVWADVCHDMALLQKRQQEFENNVVDVLNKNVMLGEILMARQQSLENSVRNGDSLALTINEIRAYNNRQACKNPRMARLAHKQAVGGP